MSEMINNKRKRTARASQLQLTKMIDYFYLNKGLAEGKFQALHGKEEAQKKWAELMTQLNSFQGATKTVDQWQVVWRDLKSRVSIKVKDLRKAKALTGNKAITQPELSEFELRVVGIIGSEYVEGNADCPDSIPDEEQLMEELERGNDSVLLETPNVITVCLNSSEKISPDTQYPNSNSYNNHNDDDLIIDSDFDKLLDVRSENDKTIHIVDNCELRKNSKACTISSVKKNRSPYLPIITKPTLSRKSNRNISHEVHSSREFFQRTAEKQADAELMHAEAAKVQATASEMHAHAMTEIACAVQKLADIAAIQADNERKRIRVFDKLVTTLNILLPDNTNAE